VATGLHKEIDMSHFGKRVITLVGVATLVGVFLLTNANPGKSAPQPATQNVLVANTAATPIPTVAQGTTSISGNVGISGTPVVGLASGATVAVTNSASKPLFVTNVDAQVVHDPFHAKGMVIAGPGSLSEAMLIFNAPAANDQSSSMSQRRAPTTAVTGCGTP